MFLKDEAIFYGLLSSNPIKNREILVPEGPGGGHQQRPVHSQKNHPVAAKQPACCNTASWTAGINHTAPRTLPTCPWLTATCRLTGWGRGWQGEENAHPHSSLELCPSPLQRPPWLPGRVKALGSEGVPPKSTTFQIGVFRDHSTLESLSLSPTSPERQV